MAALFPRANSIAFWPGHPSLDALLRGGGQSRLVVAFMILLARLDTLRPATSWKCRIPNDHTVWQAFNLAKYTISCKVVVMDFKQYVAQAEKQFSVRIKTIVAVDDAAMDKIERALAKYDPVEIGRPKKTIMQKNPLDFANVGLAEVWIIDAVFALPVSPSVMAEDVRKALDTVAKFVAVRLDDEALELETLRLDAVAEIEAEAERRGLVAGALLSSDPEFVEAGEDEALFGDGYNAALLSYLGKVEDERAEQVEQKAKALFNWLGVEPVAAVEREPKQDMTNYNADIAGAPEVKPATAKAKLPRTKRAGNLVPKPETISRVYTDKDGKRVVLTRKLGGE